MTIVNVQAVVTMKRGVNDGRTIPDDALGAAIVLRVSTVKTMEAAHTVVQKTIAMFVTFHLLSL